MNTLHHPDITDGPWEAVDSLTVRGPFEIGNPAKPGMLIATLPPHRAAGDAQLIAATPDLLAALIVLRERHQIDEPHHAYLCAFCQMADAAIEKATATR